MQTNWSVWQKEKNGNNKRESNTLLLFLPLHYARGLRKEQKKKQNTKKTSRKKSAQMQMVMIVIFKFIQNQNWFPIDLEFWILNATTYPAL